MKKQTCIVEKQYQALDMVFSSNKNNENVNESLIKGEAFAKKNIKEKNDKPNLIYKKISFLLNHWIFIPIKFLWFEKLIKMKPRNITRQ